MPESPPPPRWPAPPPSSRSYGHLTEEQSKARDRRNHIWIAIGSVLAVAALAWLGWAMLQSAREAKGLVAGLHTHMQKREVDLIYAESTSEWKQKANLDQTRTLFTKIDQTLGSPVVDKQLSFRTEATPQGRFLYATYSTQFQQDAVARESIVWKFEDGKYRLLGYHVFSKKFLSRSTQPAAEKDPPQPH